MTWKQFFILTATVLFTWAGLTAVGVVNWGSWFGLVAFGLAIWAGSQLVNPDRRFP